jgi:hypothetical protein
MIVSDRLLRGLIVADMNDMLNSYLRIRCCGECLVTRWIMGAPPNRITQYFYGEKLGDLAIEQHTKICR